MNREAELGRRTNSRLGYGVVLLSAALFVASCFLPFFVYASFGPGEPSETAISLYRQLVTNPLYDGFDFGGLIYLFAGVTIAATVAILGAARTDLQAVPSMLAVAVASWSLTSIGTLLLYANTPVNVSLEVGFWVQAASIGLAVLGAVLVLTTIQGKVRDPQVA